MAEVVAGEPDAVEYPEGHWIAQSIWHGEAVGLATAALPHHFRDRDDVLVAMELVVYYERGDKRAWLQRWCSAWGVQEAAAPTRFGRKERRRTLS